MHFQGFLYNLTIILVCAPDVFSPSPAQVLVNISDGLWEHTMEALKQCTLQEVGSLELVENLTP